MTESFELQRRDALKKIGAGGLVAATGIAGRASAQNNIVLGQPAAITGKWSNIQPAVSKATDMAIKEINETGGPLGRNVNLVRRDTAVSPSQARTVVQQLINNDNAAALLGLYSSEITPLFGFLNEQRVPVVSPWPGAVALDKRGGDKLTPDNLEDDGWVWRTTIGDTVHTIGAARFMRDEKFKRMALLHGTSQGAASWADAFATAFQNAGGTIVKQLEVSEGKRSYQSALSRLFNADFDAWGFELPLEDAITLLREAANAGYDKPLLITDVLRDPSLIERAGQAAQGSYIASATGAGPNYSLFRDKYQKFTGVEMNPWSSAAWDAANVTALAIQRAGEATPEAIEQNLGPVSRKGGKKVATFKQGKEALQNGNEINYQGAATVTNFTKYGNVLGSVGVERVTPDGFEQIKTIPAGRLEGLIEGY